MMIDEFVNFIDYRHGWDIFVLPGILMIVDIITGFYNAWKRGEIKSGKLRQGIVNKAIEVLAILFFYFLGKTVGKFASGYVIFAEFISICENLDKIGIKIPPFIKTRIKDLGGFSDGEKE